MLNTVDSEIENLNRLITNKENEVALKKLTTKKSQKAKEIILKHHEEFYGTLSDTEVMKLAEVSHNTFYKYKRELKEGLKE